MWHIPINATEHSLLYATETFEQFEGLLQFFEKLDNEENDAWWEKLANDIGRSDSADLFETERYSDRDYDDEYDEYDGEFDGDDLEDDGYDDQDGAEARIIKDGMKRTGTPHDRMGPGGCGVCAILLVEGDIAGPATRGCLARQRGGPGHGAANHRRIAPPVFVICRTGAGQMRAAKA